MYAVQVQRPLASGHASVPRQRQYRVGKSLSIHYLAKPGREASRFSSPKFPNSRRPERARIATDVRGDRKGRNAHLRKSISYIRGMQGCAGMAIPISCSPVRERYIFVRGRCSSDPTTCQGARDRNRTDILPRSGQWAKINRYASFDRSKCSRALKGKTFDHNRQGQGRGQARTFRAISDDGAPIIAIPRHASGLGKSSPEGIRPSDSPSHHGGLTTGLAGLYSEQNNATLRGLRDTFSDARSPADLRASPPPRRSPDRDYSATHATRVDRSVVQMLYRDFRRRAPSSAGQANLSLIAEPAEQDHENMVSPGEFTGRDLRDQFLSLAEQAHRITQMEGF